MVEMVKIKVDLQELSAYHCKNCGRVEAPPKTRQKCPACGETMQHCSRYEWALSDALDRRLTMLGFQYKITEQYPVKDRSRHFNYWFDLFIQIVDGAELLVEVDADLDRHGEWRHNSKTGGRFNSDWTKAKSAGGKRIFAVSNASCSAKNVDETAWRLVRYLFKDRF